jgi:hypothetical protein
LAMSAATIDRILKGVRASATGQRRRKGSTAIRRSVPVRTFSDWNNPAPGFVEADLVAHSGPFAKGAYTQRWHVGKPYLHLVARPLLTQHNCAPIVQANNVERVFTDIDADCANRSLCCRRHGMPLVLAPPGQLIAGGAGTRPRLLDWEIAGH